MEGKGAIRKGAWDNIAGFDTLAYLTHKDIVQVSGFTFVRVKDENVRGVHGTGDMQGHGLGVGRGEDFWRVGGFFSGAVSNGSVKVGTDTYVPIEVNNEIRSVRYGGISGKIRGNLFPLEGVNVEIAAHIAGKEIVFLAIDMEFDRRSIDGIKDHGRVASVT